MPIKKTKVVKTKNQSFSNKIDATAVASNIEDILVNFIPAYEENLEKTEKTLKKITSILKDEAQEGEISPADKKEIQKQEQKQEQQSFLNILGKNMMSSLKMFKDFSIKTLSNAWKMATNFISEQYKNLKIFVEEGFKTLTGVLDQSLRTAQEMLPMLLSFIPFGSIIGKIVGGILFGIPRILLKVIPKIISGLFNIGGIIGKALFIDLPKKLGGIIKDSLTTPSGLIMWALIFGYIFRKHLMQLFKTYVKPIWDTYVQPAIDEVWGSVKAWFGDEKNIKWLRSFFPKPILDIVDGIVNWWKDENTQSWLSAIKDFTFHPLKTFTDWWNGKDTENNLFDKIGTALSNWWSTSETKKWLSDTIDKTWNFISQKMEEYTSLAIDLIWEYMHPKKATKDFREDIKYIEGLKLKGNTDFVNRYITDAANRMLRSDLSPAIKELYLKQSTRLYTNEKIASAELKTLMEDSKRAPTSEELQNRVRFWEAFKIMDPLHSTDNMRAFENRVTAENQKVYEVIKKQSIMLQKANSTLEEIKDKKQIAPTIINNNSQHPTNVFNSDVGFFKSSKYLYGY